MKHQYIVLQAYGNLHYVHETLYLILSYIRLDADWKQKNIRFVIYTDMPEAFRLLKDHSDIFLFEYVEQKQITEWQGTPPFVHRVKIKILQDFFQKYEGNLLYLDTDTYFLQSPEKLFQQIQKGFYLMHLKEGIVSDGYNTLAKKIHRLLEKQVFVIGQKNIKIPTDTPMYNAGVLGIASGKKDVLQEVLAWTDRLYACYQKHIMEQLAFSYVLSQGNLLESQEIVFHYWDFKEFRGILQQFFDFYAHHSLEELAEKSYQIIPKELSKDKEMYYQLSFWGKLRRKIKGSKWVIPQPTFQQ